MKSGRFELSFPEHGRDEVEEHLAEMAGRISITLHEAERLIELLLRHVKIIPAKEYEHLLDHTFTADLADEPFLAAARLVDADGIWTHDAHLLSQKAVRTFTNDDLLSILRTEGGEWDKE